MPMITDSCLVIGYIGINLNLMEVAQINTHLVRDKIYFHTNNMLNLKSQCLYFTLFYMCSNF